MWPFNSPEKKAENTDDDKASLEVESEVKRRLKQILKRAREKSNELEEEWRNPAPPDLAEVHYYVDEDEQDTVEPSEIKKKKPRPYRSYSEIVLEEIEKESKR